MYKKLIAELRGDGADPEAEDVFKLIQEVDAGHSKS
jgi:hypothetical protein